MKKEHKCIDLKTNNLTIVYDDYKYDGWVLHYGDHYRWETLDDIDFCPYCGMRLAEEI